DRIQHHNFCTLTSRVEKRVRVRLNLRLDQSPLDFIPALLQGRNDSSGRPRLKTRDVGVPVIVSDLLLADHYEISKTKVQIFFHLETLFDDFVQFFTGQAHSLEPLLKLNLRRKISRE